MGCKFLEVVLGADWTPEQSSERLNNRLVAILSSRQESESKSHQRRHHRIQDLQVYHRMFIPAAYFANSFARVLPQSLIGHFEIGADAPEKWFSERLESHRAAVNLRVCFYNLFRYDQSPLFDACTN